MVEHTMLPLAGEGKPCDDTPAGNNNINSLPHLNPDEYRNPSHHHGTAGDLMLTENRNNLSFTNIGQTIQDLPPMPVPHSQGFVDDHRMGSPAQHHVHTLSPHLPNHLQDSKSLHHELRPLPHPRDFEQHDPLGYRVTHNLNNNVLNGIKSEEAMPVSSGTNDGDVQPSTCGACGGKIIDRYYLLAVDKPWHVNCLKCADCQLPLDSELTCFAKDGSIYCKEDYYRRFAVKRCSRCQMGISSNELVMRARDLVYHLACFTCASCCKTLTTGDYFGMQDDLIYCRTHYEVVLQGDFIPGMSPLPGAPHGTDSANMPFYNNNAPKGRPRKRKSQSQQHHDNEARLMGMPPNENELLHMESIYGHSQQPGPPRQKRVRTSFKHHQLRTMKSYFALNHNPDAKDLKQLAQKTGLSKRVLQVWFQNARAKHRRNLLKQQGSGDATDGSGKKNNSSSGSSQDDDLETSGNTLDEISEAHSPSAMSDISSTPSFPDLHQNAMETSHDSSGSTLSELFSHSINTTN